MSSNIPLLKIVFTLLESADQMMAGSEDAEITPVTDLQPIFTAQELIHPIEAAQVDVKRILQNLPARASRNVSAERQLVITVTE